MYFDNMIFLFSYSLVMQRELFSSDVISRKISM